MKIALVQTNPTVGAVESNANCILDGILRAKDAGAALAVFPELALPGYPPLDLVERRPFVAKCEAEERRIAGAMPEGIHALFGNIGRAPSSDRSIQNIAVLVARREATRHFAKTLLPTYDVFDEARFFEANRTPEANVFELSGETLGVGICEDVWNDRDFWRARDAWRDKGDARRYDVDPIERVVSAGARILVTLSASPFARSKGALRRELLAHTAKRHGAWLLYANLVGGNDGLLFDGESMAFAPDGRLVSSAARWKEDMIVVDCAAPGAEVLVHEASETREIRDALTLGIADYFRKTGIPRAFIGLSGGIDSAVTACLAVRALGRDRVVGLAMPSRYSSAGSVDDARGLANALGIELHVVPIHDIFDGYLKALEPMFFGRAMDVAEENLQSRIRGALLMAVANKFGGALLATGNKSEAAMGYCTLYGDTCGALAPLADLYKHQVYALAHLANEEQEMIPRSTIEKAPSAELRPDQKDEDTLPPYRDLDRILEAFLEHGKDAAEIARDVGVDVALASDVIRRVYANEFKRKQFPPTLRVSRKAWVGRVCPIAHAFSE